MASFPGPWVGHLWGCHHKEWPWKEPQDGKPRYVSQVQKGRPPGAPKLGSLVAHTEQKQAAAWGMREGRASWAELGDTGPGEPPPLVAVSEAASGWTREQRDGLSAWGRRAAGLPSLSDAPSGQGGCSGTAPLGAQGEERVQD